MPGEHNTDNNKASFPVDLLAGRSPPCTSPATAALIVAIVGVRRRRDRARSRLVGVGQGAARPRRAARCCSAAAARISSTSPSRSRAASTTCTARSTRSRPGLSRVDRRVDGTVTNTSIVRYDAYEDTGGHQSASLALLDAARTGVVVTAIQGRDYARIYMKELDRGRASVALSPEEQEAVERAMGR